MPYSDLREWIDYLEGNGEVVRVKKEVDRDLEVGAITRRVYDLHEGAPLFENIKGFAPGFRILGAPLGLSKNNRYARLASVLDMPLESSWRELTEAYLRKRANPIEPNVVLEAPCHQNVMVGPDVDLDIFPVPFIHDEDGGRYIGTWHATITKDPDSEWVNYGMYRHQVFEKNKLGIPAIAIEHAGQHYLKQKARGKRLEVAIAIGSEPVCAMMSATGLPAGVSEVAVAGGIRGKAVDIVKCKTIELYVPASSEIVIEGYIDPSEKHKEGPFGEYTGYNAGGDHEWPVLTVTAITYRDDPIITMSCMGVPVDDSGVVFLFTAGAEILEELRDRRGYPVNFVAYPHAGVCHICAISLSSVPYKAFPQTVATAAWATKPGNDYSTVLLIVNDDVDVTDPEQVLWAMATRVHPTRDVHTIKHSFAVPLLPYLSPEERMLMVGPRVLLDGTWPTDWKPEWVPKVSAFNTLWPIDIQKRVIDNWREYGFSSR